MIEHTLVESGALGLCSADRGVQLRGHSGHTPGSHLPTRLIKMTDPLKRKCSLRVRLFPPWYPTSSPGGRHAEPQFNGRENLHGSLHVRAFSPQKGPQSRLEPGHQEPILVLAHRCFSSGPSPSPPRWPPQWFITLGKNFDAEIERM